MTESACPIPAQPIAPLHTHAVSFFNAGQQERQERVLAAEVPIALVFNGISHAVMMGSPTDVEDFALGFALTEEELSLRALTARLEPELQELVLLRFGQQLKLREIAQVTGLPLRTVQSRLRSALKTLKIQLEQEDLP